MNGVARCALCRREVEFTDAVPRRCAAREGGCGAAGGMRVLRVPSREAGTAGYAAEARPTLPEQARALEEALVRAGAGT